LIHWVAFDLDDTIYNGTLLVEKARRAAILMMINNGLPVDIEYAIKILDEIIIEFGTNSENHLDYLLMRLQNDPKIRLPLNLNLNKLVAAGVIGYHREKVKHFKLFRDVNSTLDELHQRGIKTAIITDGMPKKQYEKILRLQLEKKMYKIII
jgi:putative hydrolase of the HAD superfamily